MDNASKPHKTIIALHDRAHCCCPGLFRAIKKGSRKKEKIQIIYQFGEDTLEFCCFDPLGADDLKVLQGLVALATANEEARLILDCQSQTEIGRQLWLKLEPQWEAFNQQTLVAKTSVSNLLAEIGLDKKSGGNFHTIKTIIERLWKVSIIVQSKGKRYGFHLLSHYASDSSTEQIYVALNPRIAEAILGKRPHARIEMHEVRALKGDLATLIHQRLCGWIDPGSTGRACIETLTRYCFPDKASPPTERKRQQRIRLALKEIKQLPGWTITEYVRNKYEIKRPKSTPS